jgi:NADPH2 dehydrogenase
MSQTPSKLFTPLKLGDITLAHRIIMAPMTRMRANDDFVLEDATIQYYSQRSSVPGTLILAEATAIAAEGMAFPNIPGIYNQAQIAAWKKGGNCTAVFVC